MGGCLVKTKTVPYPFTGVGKTLCKATPNDMRQAISEALAAPGAEATECAHAQAVAHADEPGWVPGNSDVANPERRTA